MFIIPLMKFVHYKHNFISAKYFIHAFAQFRWGVFQEYSEDGESEFYFSPYYGRPDAIKCNQNLKGLIVRSDLPGLVICYPQNSIDPHTNLYLSTCKWRPYPVRQRAKTSIMDHQYIQAVGSKVMHLYYLNQCILGSFACFFLSVP